MMQGRVGKLLQVLVFFAIGIGIMYWVFVKQEVAYQAECALKRIPAADCNLLDKIITDISNAHIVWIVISMLIFVLSNIIRALRWRMMFESIGYQPRFINLLGSIFINYLANLGIPRSGEVIRATVLSRYEGIPFDKTFGTVVADRILDAIMFGLFLLASLLFGGSIFLAYIDRHLGSKLQGIQNNTLLLASLLVGIIGFVAFLWTKRDAIVASTPAKKVWGIIQGFVEGIQSVKGVSNMPLFILYTLGIWGCYYVMLHVMFFAFEPTADLGPIAALIVFVFGSLGMLVPTPGGMGPYHFLISEGLQLNGVNSIDGFTFANILFFSIQVGITILCGILALVAMPLLNKNESK
jgi:glycosyltransferase 2 family protein